MLHVHRSCTGFFLGWFGPVKRRCRSQLTAYRRHRASLRLRLRKRFGHFGKVFLPHSDSGFASHDRRLQALIYRVHRNSFGRLLLRPYFSTFFLGVAPNKGCRQAPCHSRPRISRLCAASETPQGFSALVLLQKLRLVQHLVRLCCRLSSPFAQPARRCWIRDMFQQV